jgi:chromosome segregation ATPase
MTKTEKMRSLSKA